MSNTSGRCWGHAGLQLASVKVELTYRVPETDEFYVPVLQEVLGIILLAHLSSPSGLLCIAEFSIDGLGGVGGGDVL